MANTGVWPRVWLRMFHAAFGKEHGEIERNIVVTGDEEHWGCADTCNQFDEMFSILEKSLAAVM